MWRGALRGWALWAATLLTGLASARADTRPTKTRLLVWAVADHNASRFETAVADNVTKPLARVVPVVPMSELVGALKHLGTRVHVRNAVGDAPEMARLAHATHVLLLLQDGQVVRSYIIEAEGGTTLSRRYPGRKLSRSSAQSIVAAVKGALVVSAPTTVAGKAPASKAVALSSSTPSPDAALPMDTPAVQTEAAPPIPRGPSWRPAGRMGAGLMLMQRTANMNVPGVTMPCYCATGANSNPFFAGAHVYAEFFPGSIWGQGGNWWENIGIVAEGFGTRVNSWGVDGKLSGSNVYDARAAVAYRWVLWDSTLAPDVTFAGGYGSFAFPLQNNLFPSLSYAAPYVGASGSVPLGIEDLVLTVGANYMPLWGQTGAATPLGQYAGGNGVQAKAGLRIRIDLLEVSAMYRYAWYNTGYKNASVILDNGTVHTSALNLSDGLGELTVSAGVIF